MYIIPKPLEAQTSRESQTAHARTVKSFRATTEQSKMFAQLLRDFGVIRVAEMAGEGAMQGLI